VADVVGPSGDEVIDAEDVVSVGEEAFAQV
jgi:hypothetical protein